MKKSFLQLETNIDSCVQIMGKKTCGKKSEHRHMLWSSWPPKKENKTEELFVNSVAK